MNTKEYPIASLDEISQWLFDNFGLLPGCCSSIKEMEYSVARMVAEALWPKQKKEEEAKEGAMIRYRELLRHAELANGKKLTSDRSTRNTDIRMMVAKKMREEGYTFREIGAASGRDHSTASYWVKCVDEMFSLPGAFRDFVARWNKFNEMLNNDGK